MKANCAVAALLLLVGGHAMSAVADEVPASSAPACDYGKANPLDLTPEELAKTAAAFKKLCQDSNGNLINLNAPRKKDPNFSQPHMIPSEDSDLTAVKGHSGQAILAIVVETDGRISSVELLRSSGYPDLDHGLLDFQRKSRYESGFVLDSRPVRVFTLMPIYQSVP